MGDLSLNILYDNYVNVEAAEKDLYPFFDTRPFSAAQVTTGDRAEQGHVFAQNLKAHYPKMDVIFRKMPDDHQHLAFPDPVKWYDSYAPWAANGLLILSNNNEPGVNDLNVQDAWMTKGMGMCGAAGIKVVAGNWPTHNEIDPSQLPGTLDMFARYDHRFGIHYYWWERAPIDPVHLTVEAYCRRKNIKVPKFEVTELGYAWRLQADKGYQYDDHQSGDNHFGKLDGAVYGKDLVDASDEWPECRFYIFGWGDHPPYSSFNTSQDSGVKSKVTGFSAPPTPTPIPVPNYKPSPDRTTLGEPIQVRVTKAATAGTNIRLESNTGSKIVGEFGLNSVIMLRPMVTPVVNDHPWYAVEQPVQGWAAGDVFSFIALQQSFKIHAPFKSYQIVSHFNEPRDYSKIGPDKKQLHEGCDFVDTSACDHIVHACAPGTVTQVGLDPAGYGNFVIIDHGNGWTTLYGHFAEIYVKPNQKVADWQILGLEGSTGNATEDHCHLDLCNPAFGASGYVFPFVVNPELYLLT